MPLVRTTIRIDDDLYREVKARAARSGRTVASVLEEAVRAGIAPVTPDRAAYVLRASGRGGVRPGVDLASNASVHEALDEGRRPDEIR